MSFLATLCGSSSSGTRTDTVIPITPLPNQPQTEGIKRIGYHLAGRFSDHTTYDIALYPGQTNYTATTTKLAGSETRVRAVEGIAPAWTLESLAAEFFSRNMIITKEGYGTLSNRRVVIHMGMHEDALPVGVDIRIEGIANGRLYRLDLNTIDIRASKAFVQVQDSTNFQEVEELNLGNLCHLNASEFQKHVPYLLNKLAVQIILSPLGLNITLDQVIPDPNPNPPPPLDPRPALDDRISLLNVHNVTDLIRLLGSRGADANKIIRGMVRLFTGQNFPFENELDEMGELMQILDSRETFLVFNSLVSRLNDQALQDTAILSLVAKILSRHQKIHSQKGRESTWQDIDIMQKEEDLNGLSASDLVRILGILTTHLKPTNKDLSCVTKQLTAIVALLDMMVLRKVDQVEEGLHKSAYNAIGALKGSPDLRVDYLANYGTQSFKLIRDNQTLTEAVLHRAFLLLRGLAKADISLLEPWHVISIIEGLPDIKEALSFQDRQKKWFVHLLSLREMIFGRTPAVFIKYENYLRNPKTPEVSSIDFHDVHLVVGYLDVLWDALEVPQIGTPEQNLQVKTMAVALYGEIYNDNAPNAAKQKGRFLISEAQYQEQLCELVIERLRRCTTHPLEAIRKEASKMLVDCNDKRAASAPPFIQTRPPSDLFKRAILQNFPLLVTLQSIQRALLELDEQFVTARPYFISLDARESSGIATKSLDTWLDEFLSGPNRVLAIGGAGGAGKSLGIKDYAAHLLEKYREKDCFPVFLSLPRLQDPIRGSVSEVFGAHGVGASPADLLNRQEFLERNTVWIFDAYDEVNLERLKGNGLNIYNTNNLHQLGAKAKIIFLYRTGAGVEPQKIFKPNQGGLQELTIEPFSERKIFEYLDRFCDVRTQNPPKEASMRLVWTKEQYRTNFEQLQRTHFWNLFANPLRLRINADIFPIIVAARQKVNSQFRPTDLFKGQEESVIENQMFTYFAVIQALRAVRKNNTEYPARAVDFLRYLARVAARMTEYGVKAIPCDLEGDYRSHFADLFDLRGLDLFTNFPNRVFFKEMDVCSVGKSSNETTADEQPKQKERLAWTFMHEDYGVFLNNVHGKDDSAKEEMIQKTITQEDFDALFGVD